MNRLFLKEFRKNNPQNQYLVEAEVYRKQREEEDRVGDQKELLSQYEKKVEERKRLNEIQKACKQDVGEKDQFGNEHLSEDGRILQVLQEVQLKFKKTFGKDKRSRDEVEADRRYTDQVAKQLKREKQRLENIREEVNPQKRFSFAQLNRHEK